MLPVRRDTVDTPVYWCRSVRCRRRGWPRGGLGCYFLVRVLFFAPGVAVFGGKQVVVWMEGREGSKARSLSRASAAAGMEARWAIPNQIHWHSLDWA